jgi:hypothetical protein
MKNNPILFINHFVSRPNFEWGTHFRFVKDIFELYFGRFGHFKRGEQNIVSLPTVCDRRDGTSTKHPLGFHHPPPTSTTQP